VEVAITEIAELRAGDGDLMEQRLPAALAAMSKHPACEAVVGYRSVEKPDVFVLVIKWTSIDAHVGWRDSAERREYRAAIAELLVGSPSFSHYNIVAQM
jgi:quinol monooxygenase YgiN